MGLIEPAYSSVDHSDRLSHGLVAAYPFGAGSGLTLRDAYGRNDGTISGATWGHSPVAPALEFVDTDSAYVELPRPLVTGDQDRTFLCWTRVDNTDATNGGFVELGQVVTGEKWSIRAASGNLRIEIEGSGYTSSLGMTTGQWHMIGCRLNGSTIGDHTLILDNEFEQASGSNAVNTASNVPHFGVVNWNNEFENFLTGAISLVLMYDRALSDREIRHLIADPFAPFRLQSMPVLFPSGNTISLTASGVATASGIGNMSIARPLSGAGAGTATGTGVLSATKRLAGAGSGVATGNGTLSRTVGLIGTGNSAVSGYAATNNLRGMAASGQGIATGDADLIRMAPLSAYGQGVAAGNATLSKIIDLIASGQGVASGRASLSRVAVLSASGQGVASGNAVLVVTSATDIVLAASGVAAASGSASMAVERTISAQGEMAASANSDISIVRAISASGQVVATGAVDMTVLRTLAASGTAVASGDAALSLITAELLAELDVELKDAVVLQVDLTDALTMDINLTD